MWCINLVRVCVFVCVGGIKVREYDILIFRFLIWLVIVIKRDSKYKSRSRFGEEDNEFGVCRWKYFVGI